ncbi:MAG: type II toxin-antitoxin system RelE/ParE family toxin [Rhizobiales bacterium]|nr:type II toxin-antitoxin system RelE/ParE family toxin [Hyphomicrobiales bacterium]
MNYRLKPQAKADIEAIGDYIARHNTAAALALIGRFARRWELLATQPYSGASRDDIAEGLRYLVIGQYLAFYRVTDDAVEIARVLHGRRGITAKDMR